MRRSKPATNGQSIIEYVVVASAVIAGVLWVNHLWGFLFTGSELLQKVRGQLTASGGLADQFLP